MTEVAAPSVLAMETPPEPADHSSVSPLTDPEPSTTLISTTTTDEDPTASTSLIPASTSADPATTTQKLTKKILRKKRRPARPQVDPATITTSELPPQTGTIFNIWYNKWSGGDREDKYLSKTAATSRCSIARDSGYTRADRVSGSYFCLFFARGLCPRGHECEYLHRLPTLHDLFNPNIDCFGRDKHSDYRDDMGGVGSFMRQNRTLYVGRIHVSDDIEEIVARHFAEWGQIERTRVLTARGVAFITYTNEANSQFAKEAMAHQSLDHSEILNVRWATVDPNPLAAKREARLIEEQAADAVRRALPADYVAEIEGRLDPEARKRKKIEGGFGLEGYEPADDLWFARHEGAIRGPEGAERALLEAPADGGQDGQEPSTEQEESHARGGLLSGSTLAALKGYSAQRQGAVTFSTPSTQPVATGPLVAYGSDDDSD
ncbi:MAG: Pre-mRNA-splicing factor [Caeruleum heppii]|nr:MAG: Pre-mRNA-splicing factor [Caeruleum heppii]